MKKLLNPKAQPEDLTGDPVIAANRFTNAYRASDRVSQYLINEVQPKCEERWEDVFACTLVFKVFNRIDLWEKLREFGADLSAEGVLSESLGVYLDVARTLGPIYSAAYMMPPPQQFDGAKHRRHMLLVKGMLEDGAHERILQCGSLEETFKILRSYESVGDFLAYQWAVDLNYSEAMSCDENEFVIPGPGALRGIKKVYPGSSLRPVEAIRVTAELQNSAFETRGLRWDGLFGRELHLIDVQNLFCEVDKYTRASAPWLSEFAKGSKIKQRYRPVSSPMTARFPDSWGINDTADRYLRERQAQ